MNKIYILKIDEDWFYGDRCFDVYAFKTLEDARKYMKEEYDFTYDHSLFSMKPILKASEVDDSRPTVIKFACTEPTFVSVLSGKINTIYDLDEILV